MPASVSVTATEADEQTFRNPPAEVVYDVDTLAEIRTSVQPKGIELKGSNISVRDQESWLDLLAMA